MGKTREKVAETKGFLQSSKVLNRGLFYDMFKVLYIKGLQNNILNFSIRYFSLNNLILIYENYIVRVFKLRELKFHTSGFRLVHLKVFFYGFGRQKKSDLYSILFTEVS